MLLYRPLRFILPVLMISGLFGVWPYQTLAEAVLVAHPALTFGDIPYYIIARGNGFYHEEDLQVKDIYIRGG